MPRGFTDGPHPFSVHIDSRGLEQLAREMKAAGDGKLLRQELVKNLRTATAPAVKDAKAVIRASPSSTVHSGQGMRQAIAASIRLSVMTGKKTTGVRIRQAPTLRTRGFRYAGRNFNHANFRHPVFGNTEVWVAQVGSPGWFDKTMEKHSGPMRRAVIKAMADMATKLASRTNKLG